MMEGLYYIHGFDILRYAWVGKDGGSYIKFGILLISHMRRMILFHIVLEKVFSFVYSLLLYLLESLDHLCL